MDDDRASIEVQRIGQLLRRFERHQPDVTLGQQDVEAGTQWHTGGTAGTQIVPVRHLRIMRAHDHRAGPIVMRLDEHRLGVAQQRVAHRRDHQIRRPGGQHGNTVFRLNRDGNQPDPQELRDGPCQIDFEAAERAGGIAHGKARIVGAQTDLDLPGT